MLSNETALFEVWLLSNETALYEVWLLNKKTARTAPDFDRWSPKYIYILVTTETSLSCVPNHVPLRWRSVQ
jgi:hypothetical protein